MNKKLNVTNGAKIRSKNYGIIITEMKMPKLYNNYKKISFGELDNQATEYIGELVHEMLVEKGINPSSYAFSIEVEYAEDEDE